MINTETLSPAAHEVLDTVFDELAIAEDNGQVVGDPAGFAADVIARLVRTYGLHNEARAAADGD